METHDVHLHRAEDHPPSFTDIGEALDFMDEQERNAITEMEAAAHEAMRLDQEDPRQQQYFRREDRKTVIRSEQEYARCEREGIRLTVIPYEAAVHALKLQDARVRQEKKAKRTKKAARQSRKRNR